MLVLSRKVSEQIVIGEHIRITLLGIAGNRIRLGITAPPGIHVVRGELRRADDNCNGQSVPAGADAPALR